MPIYLILPYIDTSMLYILSKYVILLFSHFKRSNKTEFYLFIYFSPPCFSLTSALAALAVWSERPALVAGTLNSGLLLHAALAALEMLGAEVLNLAGLVVGIQLHASWAGAQDALTRCDGTVVAAASIIHRAKI